MAYPGETTHVDYLKYVEAVSNGEEPGPQLSKEEWMKRRQQQSAAPSDAKPKPMQTVLSDKE